MYFNNSGGSWIQRIPQATRILLIINVAMWLLCYANNSFEQLTYSKLGLHYWGASMFNPLQLVSYLFVHGGFMHLFFNMFALFSFGSLLERVWGTSRYVVFYFICGIGAGVVQEVIWTLSWEHDYIANIAVLNSLSFDEMKEVVKMQLAEGNSEFVWAMDGYKNSLLTIGASGAIFGLLTGFAFVFPNMPMYVFFIPVPIKAKYLMIGYGVIELFFGVSGTMESVAHYAHLGGMLFGLIMIFIWYKKNILHG